VVSSTVVTRDRWRRWVVVAAGAAALLAVSVAVDAVPSRQVPIGADALRERVLASAAQPYSGYGESVGRLGVPELPELDEVAALLSGTSRMRAWYAGPDRWRVDDLTAAGERGTYRLGDSEFVWDYEGDSLTRIEGRAPVRLPRAADLLAPELARRLLALGAGEPVRRLGARRVAGIEAAGLRLSPADPQTTVGAVDVWADPASGLALRVEVTTRGAERPVLVSRMLEVSLAAPAGDVLTPSASATSGRTVVRAVDIAGVLRGVGTIRAPSVLAGRTRVTPSVELPGVGLYGGSQYGGGLSAFVAVPLSRGLASRILDGARNAGAAEIPVPAGAAIRLQTPLLTLAVVRVRRGGYLLAGAVTPAVLDQAAAELATLPSGGPR